MTAEPSTAAWAIRQGAPVVTLAITVQPLGPYGGHDVYLQDALIARRPFDGSNSSQVVHEVSTALAGLLRERLAWPEEAMQE